MDPMLKLLREFINQIGFAVLIIKCRKKVEQSLYIDFVTNLSIALILYITGCFAVEWGRSLLLVEHIHISQTTNRKWENNLKM
jgi:hypothetical protein